MANTKYIQHLHAQVKFMKNTFHFTLKALFVLKKFKFLS